MTFEQVDKKLREARFFLDKMDKQERRTTGDREPFDFFLSAFLNAARSVDYRLRHEQRAYAKWRKAWNANNPSLDEIIKFVSDDRNLEVPASGSRRDAKEKYIALPRGTGELVGAPGYDTAAIGTLIYSFDVKGTERKATEVCDEALRALEQMVGNFKAGRRVRP
jgi:hypothetical protein